MTTSAARKDWPSRPLVAAMWLLALPLMLLFVDRPQVSRTQEARVLETARQMLGQPPIDWIIPKLNGDLRLQKPPLMYWLTAGAYSITGRISEGVGRVPNVIFGWLTLLVVYQCGAWLFNGRAGFLAGACLLGSYYFCRHTRLAETDVPAMFFVTLGIYALWRGVGIEERGSRVEDGEPILDLRLSTVSAAWMHLGAFAIGMSILSKGATGLYPILFLIGLAIFVVGSIPVFRRLILSGAPITLGLIALPWFVYVGHHGGWDTFLSELKNTEEGGDHGGTILEYIPWFFAASAPWPIVALIGLVKAWRERSDLKLGGLLVWVGAIFLPLCFAGNKQGHYLIPLMPVCALLCGWMLDRWNHRGLMIGAIACAVILPPLSVGWMLPAFARSDTRETARLIRESFGDGPYCFFGPNQSIPLCFNLRQTILFASDETELNQIVRTTPDVVIITLGKSHRPASAPSVDRFEPIKTIERDEQVWSFYRAHRGHL